MGRLLESVAEALWAEQWSADQVAFQDCSKTMAVLAGWCASHHVSPGTVVSLMSHLARIPVQGRMGPCPDWPILLHELSAQATDAYFSVHRETIKEEWARLLQDHTPLVRITEQVPALLAVAQPPSGVWEDLLDRLLTEAVRMGATSMIVDVTHAKLPLAPLLESLTRFADHKHARRRNIFVIGLDSTQPLPRSNLLAVSSLAEAVARAAASVD